MNSPHALGLIDLPAPNHRPNTVGSLERLRQRRGGMRDGEHRERPTPVNLVTGFDTLPHTDRLRARGNVGGPSTGDRDDDRDEHIRIDRSVPVHGRLRN